MSEDPRQLAARLQAVCDDAEPMAFMEVCGTHTVALFRTGLKSLLPPALRLVSGPGCPVCVTAQGYIDAAIALAREPGVTVATYGDMVRVPGESGSLAQARAAGGEILVCYGARDAVAHARAHPERQVVFLAVGFETTAPGSAVAVLEAAAAGLENFSILPGHKLVVPAMTALLAAGTVPLQGFLCPGHVSVIIGSQAYAPLVERFAKSCVVAGFEPDSMLRGLLRLAEAARDGTPVLDNTYAGVVAPEGNPQARAIVDRVFTPADATWRAMGVIPDSGLTLRAAYAGFDARTRFGVEVDADCHAPGCRCGEVIQGRCEPAQCGLFGTTCTPIRPIGPCMVSSEGTCAAWYRYGGVSTAPRSRAGSER